MGWFRVLNFRKQWVPTSEDNFRIINNSELMDFILEESRLYGLTIKSVDLNDVMNCTIRLFGDKESFLIFVNDFVKKYKSYISDISF